MRLIEKDEAADEETQVDFMAAMDAAMTGRSKEILEDFRCVREAAEEDPDREQDPDAEDEAEGATEGEDAQAEEYGPGDPKDGNSQEEADSKPEKTTRRRSGSHSGARTGS